MKRFSFGLITGLLAGLLLATTTLALASPNTIKLIINNQEIQCDVPPRVIDGRVMVPARFVAEPLGAKVEWDDGNRAVVISSIQSEYSTLSQSAVQQGYYPARDIVQAFTEKYPNLKPASSNLNIEPRKGEYRFLITTGELWFNGKKFILPKQEVNSRLYFSIEPLIQEQILTFNDI